MGVSPRRIGQVGHRSLVIVAVALIKDEEIVAVKMHGVSGVGGGDVVVENDADGGGLAEIVNVPFGRERVGDIPAVGFAEDGVTVFIRQKEKIMT